MATNESCILFYGGSNEDWVSRFTETANRVAQHRVLQQYPLNISINDVAVRSDNKKEVRAQLPKSYADGRRVDASDICRRLIKNQSGWVVLSQGNVILLSDDGETMLQVLKNFDQQEYWMRDLSAGQGFGVSFMNSHRRRLFR